ncbi:MAG: putative manganese-dependent inorganic diphosphatase [Chthoniobacterales bacterium]|nr:putative manganese-dependent inorganic diphosphatase [Chthoniobacterales bacterium]
MDTIVIGHRNPDMDSVCSAIAYASLKTRLGSAGVRAARAGALNERITFVLEKFGVPQPDFVPDVTPRVRDVMIAEYVAAHPDRPVAESLEKMSSLRLRALPVVDDERRFRGVVSENKLLERVLPAPESASQARKVTASLANIAKTFDGVPQTGALPENEEEYALIVAAMSIGTFVERMVNMDRPRTVLFVGDRENVQLEAIRGGVRALVVTGGCEIPEPLLEEARRRDCCIISSQLDTATSVILARGAVVARHVMEPVAEKFDADMALSLARRSVALSNKFIFPVIDAEGRLEGILSKSDFLKSPARQLVLVDHNELSQAVPGASEVPIVEILDHHRLGNMPTEAPILFINQPVGSTCTLVADLHRRNGIDPERAVAGLLMAGIIADTLNGTSPTATDLDRRYLRELSEFAGIPASELAGQIFSVGSPLQTLTPEQVVTADCKEYEERGVRFSVSQIEEVTFLHFEQRREQLQSALRERMAERRLLFAALLVTDINKQNSYLLVEGDADYLRTIHYPEQSDRVWFLEGVVSRKKQLLPFLTECLAAVR